MVRVGAVGPGADDDERHFRMPFGDNGFGNIGGNVSLGATGFEELRHPGVHPVDRGTGGAQRVDLGGILVHPQLPQHIGGQHRHRAQPLGQRQQVQRGHRVGDRGAGVSAEGVGHQVVGILAIHPVLHRQTEIGGGRLL